MLNAKKILLQSPGSCRVTTIARPLAVESYRIKLVSQAGGLLDNRHSAGAERLHGVKI
jgi:hypothetical protein